MEFDLIILLCIIIIVCSTIALTSNSIEAKDYITCIGLVLSFLSGRTIGYIRGLKAGKGVA